MKLIYFILLSFLLISCAEPPEAKLAEIENLRLQTSAYSGSSNFSKADNYLTSAKQEIITQSSKFALFRNFDKAILMLENAEQGFLSAKYGRTSEELEARLKKIPAYGLTSELIVIQLDEDQLERIIKALEKGSK